MVRLAALDERFAAGEVSQADYDVERERGKQRLRELMLARRERVSPACALTGLTARYAGQPRFDIGAHRRRPGAGRGRSAAAVGTERRGQVDVHPRLRRADARRPAGTALIAGQPARSARGLVGVVSHATYLYDELTAARKPAALRAALRGCFVEGTCRGAARARRCGAPGRRAGRTPVAWAATARDDRAGAAARSTRAAARRARHGPRPSRPSVCWKTLATAPDRTVILTTHNLASGLRLGTRCAILARGRLAYEQDHISTGDTSALAERLAELAR